MLEDIFDCWEIRDETIVVKSDNPPTQYKNKWTFESYSSLVKKYNVCIIQIYGAAGHGKDMIDAMSCMSYSVIDQAAVDRKCMEKKARKIGGCMISIYLSTSLVNEKFMYQSSCVIVIAVWIFNLKIVSEKKCHLKKVC